MDLGQGASITAQNVVLTADSGAVNIAGTINASSAAGGGSIALSAYNDVSLGATAIISASGTGNSAGGRIELASTAGSVFLDSVSQVSANGAAGTGTLLLRAPQSLSGNDANIANLPANLSQVGTVILEPMVASSIDSTPTAPTSPR